VRINLDRFVIWFGRDKMMTDVDGQTLEQYHTHLLGLSELGNYSKRDAIQVAKQFIRNRSATGAIPLPPNIESKELSFRIEAKEVETMPIADLQRLLEASSDTTKLYLLLMINCGMTQSDIAALRRDEIDLEARTITRRRTKTRNHRNAPTTTYPLWSATLEMLKEHIADEGDLALVNRDGEPLVRRVRRADGKLKRTDNVKSALARIYQKLKNDGEGVDLPPKHIRKTGSTLLASEYNESVAYDYLADVPSGIAARHYVKPDAEKFAKAIEWLGRVVAPSKDSYDQM